MKNWKTTLGGSLQALGISISAIAPNDIIWLRTGLVIAAIGGFFAHLAAQDAPQIQIPNTQPTDKQQ